MKIFIDTANIKEIKEMKNFIDGVTTNPSLISKEKNNISKEKNNFHNMIYQISKITNGPISAEVISLEKQNMLSEARELAQIAKNIVIKLPLTEEGLKTCFELSKENIKTNITLCFSPIQALLAAKANASYISPFVGRLDDINYNGIKLVKDIIQIYDNYKFNTQVIAASIRHPLHTLEAAKAKAHIATIPYKIIKMLFKHPLTDKGIDTFIQDWNKYTA